MKGKTYIIATRDFTCINFSIFPEMAIYFKRKICFTQNYHYHLRKELHHTVAGHNTYYSYLGQWQSHLIIQSSKSNM